MLRSELLGFAPWAPVPARRLQPLPIRARAVNVTSAQIVNKCDGHVFAIEVLHRQYRVSDSRSAMRTMNADDSDVTTSLLLRIDQSPYRCGLRVSGDSATSSQVLRPDIGECALISAPGERPFTTIAAITTAMTRSTRQAALNLMRAFMR